MHTTAMSFSVTSSGTSIYSIDEPEIRQKEKPITKLVKQVKKLPEFEANLTCHEVYEKYKTNCVESLNNIIQKYYKDKLEFIDTAKEEDYLCSAYMPIGYFKLIHQHHFCVRHIESQCGLRAVHSYFNWGYYLDDMSSNNRQKLYVIIFMCIMKMIWDKKPRISLLLSDTPDSPIAILLRDIFQHDSSIYSATNPNSGNIVNYYMLNAKTLNLL